MTKDDNSVRLALGTLLLCLIGVASAEEMTPEKKRAGVQVWEDIADAGLPSYYSGNKLLEIAGTDKNAMANYVVGVHDALKIKELFCVPNKVTVGQMADVVVKYLTNNPENRQEQAHYLVRLALTEAWPCRLR